MIDVKDFKIGIIYMYTSPSGKYYIGQTVNEKSRKSQHKTLTSEQTYFGNAIKKYGFENFKYEILIKFNLTSDIDKLKRVLDKLEKRYIKLYNSCDRSIGYNLNIGGNGNKGYAHSPETIAYLKTCPKSQQQMDNLKLGRLKGKSEETRKRMSAANTSKKQVEKYDMEDTLIDTFISIVNAAKSVNEKYKGTQRTKAKKIGECCNEKRKSIYGFVWKFKIS